MSFDDITSDLHASLVAIYEEVMWLSARPNVTASRARAWYTHIMAESVKRQLRRFTGSVSVEATNAGNSDLRLEHFMRIQTTLTELVTRHKNQVNANEFVRTLIDYERVHIVTAKENYDAMRARGDYVIAGIALVPWDQVPAKRQEELWRRMLRGRVANAAAFAPKA